MQTSKATLTYQTALGISVGDRVSTSYGTGGIVTHVSKPYYVEYDVSGLVVRLLDEDFVVSIRKPAVSFDADIVDDFVAMHSIRSTFIVERHHRPSAYNQAADAAFHMVRPADVSDDSAGPVTGGDAVAD